MTGTVEEMYWEVLPHPAYSTDLVAGDFHLFGPLKETLGGNRRRIFCAKMAGHVTTNFFQRRIMVVPERWHCTEAQLEYAGKQVLLLKETYFIKFIKSPVYIWTDVFKDSVQWGALILSFLLQEFVKVMSRVWKQGKIWIRSVRQCLDVETS
jgi:hypothetical protein